MQHLSNHAWAFFLFNLLHSSCPNSTPPTSRPSKPMILAKATPSTPSTARSLPPVCHPLPPPLKLQASRPSCCLQNTLTAPTSKPPTLLKIPLHHGPQHTHAIEFVAFLLTGDLPRSVIGLRYGLNIQAWVPHRGLRPDAEGCALMQMASPRCRRLCPDADGSALMQTAVPQCRWLCPNAEGCAPMQRALPQHRRLRPDADGCAPTQMALPQCRRLCPDADGSTPMQTALPQRRQPRPNAEGCAPMQRAVPQCRGLPL
ncbi:hypothetical protein BC826DRAFT_973587 [Russula brevipes]|nr:hypothetical protein BC826DRAFT_973587 [Russula brevipes]